METERWESYSIDELLYWIFRGSANARAGMYEPSEMKDARRAWFPEALVEIEELNPSWRNRLEREQQGPPGYDSPLTQSRFISGLFTARS